MGWLLSQVKLEDVLQSTHESMQDSPDSGHILALVMGIAAVVLVLLVVHHRRRSEARPKALNHAGKLLKEVLKSLPLRGGEVRQLKGLAEQEGCSSPLVLILCPSVLIKAIKNRPAKGDRKVLGRLVRKVGLGREKALVTRE